MIVGIFIAPYPSKAPIPIQRTPLKALVNVLLPFVYL